MALGGNRHTHTHTRAHTNTRLQVKSSLFQHTFRPLLISVCVSHTDMHCVCTDALWVRDPSCWSFPKAVLYQYVAGVLQQNMLLVKGNSLYSIGFPCVFCCCVHTVYQFYTLFEFFYCPLIFPEYGTVQDSLVALTQN